ncbi:MAG: trypsin-like serine protease [Lawsonibacter sp.]|nr:trypsin-like serine protease [Lawsonibacter sp.]
MEYRPDELWQGGPWEQPAPVFPAPPQVVIPKPRPAAPPRRARRRGRSRRRSLFLFTAAVVLICGLTAVCAVLFRDTGVPMEQSPWTGPSAIEDAQTGLPAALPRAETGSGVTVPISPPSGPALTYTQVFERNQRSIVTVLARDRTGSGQGTGIVLTEDGYVITNAHVVQDAQMVTVELHNQVRYSASLVGYDLKEDLAVLKIEAEGLAPAQFGDSSLLRVGDQVSAIGNPLGYTMTMTPGIISAVDREVEMEGNRMYLLQTSAAINFGNSGGALLNDRGQVVGVTTVKIVSSDGSAEALGFAIPTERVKYVVDQLIAGEEIKTPRLGITLLQKPAGPPGLEVAEIEPWSDAAVQGLRIGDRIVAADGISVSTNRELARIKDLHRVGDRLLLEVLRDGETLEFSVLLTEQPDS